MALSALTTFLVKGLVWDSFQNCTVMGTRIINTKLVKKINNEKTCLLPDFRKSAQGDIICLFFS